MPFLVLPHARGIHTIEWLYAVHAAPQSMGLWQKINAALAKIEAVSGAVGSLPLNKNRLFNQLLLTVPVHKFLA